MNWWTVAPTVGSFFGGLAFAAWSLILWFPGIKALGKDPFGFARELVPFLFAYAYGMLVILGVGGVVGWIADGIVWSVGWVGDTAFVYGVGGTRQSLADQGKVIALTNGGLLVVMLMTVIVFAILKRSGTRPSTRTDIRNGALAGILTGTVASVSAAFAVPLATGANWAGSLMNGIG